MKRGKDLLPFLINHETLQTTQESSSEVGEIFEAFGVFTNTDRVEGRGSKILIHICANKPSAKEMAKGEGIMGTDADVKTVTLIKANNGKHYLIDKPVEIVEITRDYLREKVLEKLTKEDCEILGLIKKDK